MQFMTRSGRRLLLFGVVGVLAAALAVPAFAQSTDETQTPSADETPSVEAEAEAAGRFGPIRSAFVEALAGELDLPVERVDEALTAVREQMIEEHRERHLEGLRERLDAAVAAGELTREQADAIAEAGEAGVLRDGDRRGFRRHDGPGWHGGPPVGDDAAGAWGDDQA
jgi:hypothetical protein